MRCCALAVLMLMLAACTDAPPATPLQVPGAEATADFIGGADWPSANRDLAATRYSPLRQINPTNVDGLRQAWSYPLPGLLAPLGSEPTPVVQGGILYTAAAGRVVALRAHTGEELWRYSFERGAAPRPGVSLWTGAAGTRVFVGAERSLLALDARSGAKALGFGAAGEVTLPAAYSAPPTVFENLVMVGSQTAPGGVYAFDAVTGQPVWTFSAAAEQQAVPDPFPRAAGSFAIDADRALLYVVLAGSEQMGDGTETNDGPFANAVVALDVRTGARRWHFQTVRRDRWGYDLRAAPALLERTIDGVRIPLLALAAKTGYLYLLNRVTGEPVFGMTDVPAPTLAGTTDRAAQPQPIPLKPPPLARVSYASTDLVTPQQTTAAHAAECRALRDSSGGLDNAGPFTPYRLATPGAAPRSAVVFPGSSGGAGAGGVALDPRAGLVFVNTTSVGDIGWLEQEQTAAERNGVHPDGERRYGRMSVAGANARFVARDEPAAATAELWPCQQPPWGQLAAVNVATGVVVWQVALGITERLPEGRQLTGRPSVGGPMTTAAGLVFIGATDDRRLRAFDARTGAEIWTTELPLRAEAVPITYLGDDGKQYVAIVVAGHSSGNDSSAAAAQSLIAYALP